MPVMKPSKPSSEMVNGWRSRIFKTQIGLAGVILGNGAPILPCRRPFADLERTRRRERSGTDLL